MRVVIHFYSYAFNECERDICYCWLMDCQRNFCFCYITLPFGCFAIARSPPDNSRKQVSKNPFCNQTPTELLWVSLLQLVITSLSFVFRRLHHRNNLGWLLWHKSIWKCKASANWVNACGLSSLRLCHICNRNIHKNTTIYHSEIVHFHW